jgi:putative nucleotidyltransferase with HDIG domain
LNGVLTVENANVLEIITRALSLIDMRLIDHGKNVALLTHRAMSCSGKYAEHEISDMCMAAVLHDVGIFKEEEIDQIAVFDAENVWSHSIYGYLFLKKFTPLAHLAPAVLFHHARMGDMDTVPPYYRDLAQILRIADRMEIATRFGGKTTGALRTSLLRQREGAFDPALVPLFFQEDSGDADIDTDREILWESLCQANICQRDRERYLETVVLSIDFRSRATVTHTIATACLSRTLAQVLKFPPGDIEAIEVGALLHDIGKAGIPVQILESPYKLDPRDMEIMRSHVAFSEQVLKGWVGKKVERIATRHHEKLNGSGYHKGISARSLTPAERLVAVTDILSALCGSRSYKGNFPKEKVISIMEGMAGEGLIDPDITRGAIGNYDYLLARMRAVTKNVTEEYESIQREFSAISEAVTEMESRDSFDFSSYFEM